VVQAVAMLASAHASPAFEPTSLAFWDLRHGLVAGYEVRPDGRLGAADVRRTDDGGRSWRVVESGRGPFQLATVRAGRAGWIAGPRRLLVTRDRGRSWRVVARRTIVQLSFADVRNGWAVADRLIATRDGGRTWHVLRQPCGTRLGLGGGALVALGSANRGWILCLDQPGAGQQGKTLYETLDAGRSWRRRARCRFRSGCTGNLPASGYAVALSFLPDGRGWLGELRGSFLATTDGGAHWRALPLSRPEVVEAHAVSLLGPRTGLALVFYSRRLAVTTDGGRTWRYVTSFRPVRR
jgi:photosystem II stability/assembly factor-like uncharacterized protein